MSPLGAGDGVWRLVGEGVVQHEAVACVGRLLRGLIGQRCLHAAGFVARRRVAALVRAEVDVRKAEAGGRR
jgi:hypothetical protein